MTEKAADGLRLPPQNDEAEQAVLAAMLLEPQSIDKVFAILPRKSFYKERHNIIYDSMLELWNEGEPVDTVTVSNYLTKKGSLEKVGGGYYLTGLMDTLPSAANVERYAEIVREKYVLRQMISTGTDMISEAYQGEDEPGVILDNAEHRLFELQRRSLSQKSFAIDQILHESLTKLDQFQNVSRKHRYSGIPSGFKDLDDLTNGFQSSELIILAGRPSMGKTALALNIARNAAMDFGHRVGIFSLEMSNYQLAMRLLTSEANVNSHRVRQGTLSKREWPRLSKAAGELSEVPIYIDDTASINILELRSRVRRFKSDHDIEMVVIDYLQLLSGRSRYDSRQQEISDISRSLKALARELDITVLALSQLSRAVEQRPGKEKRPIMSDLRESGAIEQDADVILFIYRPFLYTRDSDDEGRAELIIGKQRNGPTGMVNLHFRAETTKFEPATLVEVPAYVQGQEETPF